MDGSGLGGWDVHEKVRLNLTVKIPPALPEVF